MMNQPPFDFETELEWEQGTRDKLGAPDLPTLEVASPSEFGGEEATWTPEHLYVAAVTACFLMTFLAIARLSRLEFAQLSIHARGKLDKIDGSGFQITSVVLQPRLVVQNERDLKRAARILEKAERNCLISSSIKTEVKVEPILENANPTGMGASVGGNHPFPTTKGGCDDQQRETN